MPISGHCFYSAAVERLFRIGKDILRLGRCGLSDNHFEMLSFFKDNLNCYYCISVYRIRIALLFGFNEKMNDFGLNTHHGALRINSVFCGMHKSNCNLQL